MGDPATDNNRMEIPIAFATIAHLCDPDDPSPEDGRGTNGSWNRIFPDPSGFSPVLHPAAAVHTSRPGISRVHFHPANDSPIVLPGIRVAEA